MIENKTINADAIEAEHRLVWLCIEDIERIDRVDADTADFADTRWRACFEELRRIREESGQVDSLVLMDSLLAKHKAKNLGDFVNNTAIPGLLSEYSRIVTEEACKRRLRLGISKAIESLNAGEGIETALSEVGVAMTDATAGEKSETETMGRIVSARVLELGELATRKARGEEVAPGLLCGIKGIDSILHGFVPGIVTLLAARPAMGKSALALNISDGICANGHGVHVFSLEDLRTSYADRFLSLHSGVSTTKIRACEFSRGDMQSLGQAQNVIGQRKGWLVDDRSGITAEEIVRCVRKHAAKNNTRFVVIDYMQLLRGLPGDNATVTLTKAINIFGDAAKRDMMSYLALSQLNRDCEKRPDKRPLLSDLKECGALEERCKCALMLYRDAVYNPPNENSRDYRDQMRAMEVLVRKNSNGPIGYVDAEFLAEKMLVR